MKMIIADGESEQKFLQSIRLRNEKTDETVTQAVRAIIGGVKASGDAALMEYTERFDKVTLKSLEISAEQVGKAYDETPDEIRNALENAAANIRAFHECQKQQSYIITRDDGVLMGQRIRGLSRVGIYVPGGRAAYPSSVLMNAIPAKVAGVGEIIMVTPPGKNGSVDRNILAAAKIAGVDRIFAIGGAQSVAALAFGTETVPKVDKIVGPGNIFVATAKRLVFGEVDIDMIAGPSEILVIADDTAEPSFLAADLMSQAEHDPMASATLLTTSKQVAERTIAEIGRQVGALSRAEIINESLQSFGAAIVFKTVEECIAAANRISPEHLELMVNNPMELLGRIDNAGSVFLGRYAPEPLGDYFAGPNHVLPTGGTARFFSPLSVDSFIKKSSYIYYTKEALQKGRDNIVTLAEAEGLTAHANSIKVRF